MAYPIQCRCGKLQGSLERAAGVQRCICYCADCQAFARYLGRDAEVLDAAGGTDIVQTLPKYLTFTSGTEHLACMRLTPNGLLRWYAACCNTPIGNTPANAKLSFVGLIHNCLAGEPDALDEAFGPVRMRVNTKHATGPVQPKAMGLSAGILRSLAMLLKARCDGSYKHTPFFLPDSNTPIAAPRVLSREERHAVRQAR
jgi:hypothetical protein